jgi:ankyrin repeat protein
MSALPITTVQEIHHGNGNVQRIGVLSRSDNEMFLRNNGFFFRATKAERREHSDLYDLICISNEESDPCATTKILKWLGDHKRLRSFQKNLLYRSEETGQTPLHLLVAYDYHGAIPVLIENAREAVNLLDTIGNTPLENGIFHCKISLTAAKMLIDANPEALRPPRGEEQNVRKKLPIHCACSVSYPRFEIVAMLLEEYPEGAKVAWHGKLPIHLACEKQVMNLDILNLLIELYPESMSIPGPDGVSPFEKIGDT